KTFAAALVNEAWDARSVARCSSCSPHAAGRRPHARRVPRRRLSGRPPSSGARAPHDPTSPRGCSPSRTAPSRPRSRSPPLPAPVGRLFEDPLGAAPGWHGRGGEPPPGAEHGEVSAVARFLRQAVAWTIHSGSARTPAADERTDLYPTRLSTETIRPPGSAEGATCHRRAPREQAGLMEEYRVWFHERRRPPRA